MNRGFTLIEMMTSVAVFAVVMTISMGSILSVIGATRKSESLKTVMDNLNLSVESMSREMRFGSVYYSCGTSPSFETPQNCSSGDDFVAFVANDGSPTIYRQNGATIEKSDDGGDTYVPVTAPEITIQDLRFYVLGTLPSVSETPARQPKVLIKIQGTAGAQDEDRTDFNVQTVVSQRMLDNQ